MIFGIVVLYLRYYRNSSYSLFGDQRYEPVPQDEDGFPLITPANGHKAVRNSHAMPSDSEDNSADEASFVSQSNTPLFL